MDLTLIYERDQLQKTYMDLCRDLGEMYIGIESQTEIDMTTNKVYSIQKELKRLNVEILNDSIKFAQTEGFILPNEVEIIKERIHNSGLLKRGRD